MNSPYFIIFAFFLLIDSRPCIAQSLTDAGFSFQQSGKEGASGIIRNHSSSPITGWLIMASHYDQANKRRSDSFAYNDAVVNFKLDSPLSPSQERRVQLAPGEFVSSVANSGGRIAATLEAVAFQNGTVVGTDFGKRVLLGRRLRLKGELEKAQQLLKQVESGQIAFEQMLSSFEDSIRSLKEKAERTRDDVERAVMMVSGLVPEWVLSSVKQSDSTCGASCRGLIAPKLTSQIEMWRGAVLTASAASNQP
jgi:hypothetical protein